MLGKTNITALQEGAVVTEIKNYSWIQQAVETNSDFIRVTFINNYLIGITGAGSIVYTRDGEVWSVSKPEYNEVLINDVDWDGSRFIVAGRYSDDSGEKIPLLLQTTDFKDYEKIDITPLLPEDTEALVYEVFCVYPENEKYILTVNIDNKIGALYGDLKNSFEINNSPYSTYSLDADYSISIAKNSAQSILCYCGSSDMIGYSITKDGISATIDKDANYSGLSLIGGLTALECKDILYFVGNNSYANYEVTKFVDNNNYSSVTTDIYWKFSDGVYFDKCEIFINNHDMLIIGGGEKLGDKTLDDLIEISPEQTMTCIEKAFGKLFIFGKKGLILKSNEGATTNEGLLVQTLSAKQALADANTYTDKTAESLRIAAQIKETANGENIALPDSTDNKAESFGLYGKCLQGGTTGKNLLDCRQLAEYVQNGLTFTPVYKNNGELEYINVNGTATANTYYVIKEELVLPAETYLLTGCYPGGSATTYFLRMQRNTDNFIVATDMGSGKTFLQEEGNNNRVFIGVDANTTVNNFKFYPMICLSDTKDTSYEPYTGGIPSPSPDYPQEITIAGAGGSVTVKRTDKEGLNETIYIISTPNGLAGVPVDSGGNYTDENGQQWVCDEIVRYADGTGKYVQNVYTITVDGTETGDVLRYGKGGATENNFFFVVPLEIPKYHCNSTAIDRMKESNYIDYGIFKQLYSTHFTAYDYKTLQVNGLPGISYGWGGVDHYEIRIAMGIDSEVNTVELFKEWCAANNPKVTYELATPIETELSAVEVAEIEKIKTLYPATNISNSDNCGMSVTYVIDLKNYIDKKVTEVLERVAVLE